MSVSQEEVNKEENLGHKLTFDTSENIHSKIRDVLDQMPEEELLLWEEKYNLL